MERSIPRLKLFRWKRGLTQKELAEKAGLPVWKISQWEAGKRIPTLVEFIRIQMVLRGNLFVFDPLELKEFRSVLGKMKSGHGWLRRNYPGKTQRPVRSNTKPSLRSPMS